MFSSYLKVFLFSSIIVLTAHFASAQAKHAIGLGVAVNGSTNGPGVGFRLQGEVKVNPKFALVPGVGIEIPYIIYGGLSGKYYFNNRFYGMLGPIFNAGSWNENSSGIGGSMAAGYELISTKRHVLDLNFHGDVIGDGDALPIIGLRLTYNFSFAGR